MNKLNYDLLMQEELKRIEKNEERPKLLLHSCCAPCSSTVIEILIKYFDVSILFYNPNITDEKEYIIRLEEMKTYSDLRNYNINIIEGDYNPVQDFFGEIKGLEKIKEGGLRCKKCYEIRMTKTAEIASINNFDYFTTALSISPVKNSMWINEIGEELAIKYNIKFLHGDFKKKGRYQESIKISKEYNLYRQDYCGCVFSKLEMEEHRKSKSEENTHE